MTSIVQEIETSQLSASQLLTPLIVEVEPPNQDVPFKGAKATQSVGKTIPHHRNVYKTLDVRGTILIQLGGGGRGGGLTFTPACTGSNAGRVARANTVSPSAGTALH